MTLYQDLIQIGILVVALANLIYQIYKGKNRYTRCRPCEFDLSDLQGKKEIAATTANSDGLPLLAVTL